MEAAANPSDRNVQFRFVVSFQGHESSVYSVQFSPCGKYIASGSYDESAKLWHVERQKEVATLNVRRIVYQVAFSPDNKWLALGNYNVVRFWGVQTQKEVASVQWMEGIVYSVQFSHDGKLIASGGNHNVNLWSYRQIDQESLAERRELATLEGHTKTLYALSFSADGKLLASGSSDSTIKIWPIQTIQQRVKDANGQKVTFTDCSTLHGHDQSVFCVAFSPDSALLASGSCDSQIVVWKRKGDMNFDVAATASHCGGHYVSSIAFSPCGAFFASAGGATVIKIWRVRDLPAAVELGEAATIEAHDSQISQVAFSFDGKYMASAGYDRKVKLWEAGLSVCNNKK